MVKDCLAITAYHTQAQTDLLVVKILVCDSTGLFHPITEQASLCWVHDGQLYKKLEPRLAYNRRLLEDFRKEYWEYYHQLCAYRTAPTPHEAEGLGH